MSGNYGRDILRIVVAQMCQTIGWNAVQSTPLELLTDVLQKYITELAENTHRYSEQFGHTNPNLHDLGLAFRDMGITLPELEEYVEFVASIPCQREVPKYPVERESHLNLLKPGSREVVTRPVHIHEHLPAMHPELEDEDYGVKTPALTVDTSLSEASSPPMSSPKTNLFKRPGDPISSLESSQLKRARLAAVEEEGRPLREISSVMMTTSGFLSPAREGKLPEARTPMTSCDPLSPPQPSPSSYPTVPPEVKGEKKSKKVHLKPGLDGTKTADGENKTKDTDNNPTPDDDDSKVKKLVSMKELTKLKALKSGALKMLAQNSSHSSLISKLPKIPKKSSAASNPDNLNVATPKAVKLPSAKSPKLPLDGASPSSPATGAPHKASPADKSKNINVDGKLPSEPDKQKLNIFKKISKVKEEKSDHSDNKSSRESSPNRPPPQVLRDGGAGREARLAQITEVIESVIQRSIVEKPQPAPAPTHPPPPPQTVDPIFLDSDSFRYDSPPGTPRTPEAIIPQRKSESKKRKKDKTKEKKEKFLNGPGSPPMKRIKCEPIEPEIMEKPKTPEIETSHEDEEEEIIHTHPIPTPSPGFPFFPNFPSAPGLVPPQIGNPGLFSRFALGKHGGLIPPPINMNLPVPSPLQMMQARPAVNDHELAPPPKPQTPPTPPTFQPSPPPPPRDPTPPPPPLTPPILTPVLTLPALTSSSKPVKQSLSPIVLLNDTVIYKSEAPEKSSSHSKEKLKEERKKEHKKEKKDKIKKKKDKKDKTKNKDRSEKKKEKLEKKERDREKIKEKKEKKEKKREKEREQQLLQQQQQQQAILPVQSLTSPTASTSTIVVEKQVENAEKQNVPKITFKLGPQSPEQPSHRKIVIKPVKKPEETAAEERQKQHQQADDSQQASGSRREPSPELARLCALVTRPPKVKSSQSKTSQQPSAVEPVPASPSYIQSNASSSKPKKPVFTNPSPKLKSKEVKKLVKESEPAKEPVAVPYYYDTDGNQVWICPACRGQDDGSPMIGCDGCDAWYHWVCVGIQVPPDSNDWFCRVCIGKKDEIVGEKKKKLRKKKSSA